MKIFGPVEGILRRDISTIHKWRMVENIRIRQCWSENKFMSTIKKDFFFDCAISDKEVRAEDTTTLKWNFSTHTVVTRGFCY